MEQIPGEFLCDLGTFRIVDAVASVPSWFVAEAAGLTILLAAVG
jgi:hypothetical protein